MRTTDLQRLYAYGSWATRRLLAAAQDVSDEAFRRSTGGSFPSLQATFDHLWGAERLWLDRWVGGAPAKAPSLGPNATPKDFVDAWEPVWDGQAAFVAALADASLDAAFDYRNQRGEPARVGTRDMLIHVANHGTYHRGQIASQLRLVGGTPVSTDYLVFAKEIGTA